MVTRQEKKRPDHVLQTTCLSESHKMTPWGYAAEMLEENSHCKNNLVEPAKTTSPARLSVRLRILKIFGMLV